MGKHSYIVGLDTKTERLDTFLSLQADLTRSHIQKLIRDGLITVNGNKEKPGFKVRANDRVELIIEDEPQDVLIPEKIPLDIIREDDSIIVVNKTSGMVVYPAAGNRSGTLMNALAYRCGRLCSIGAPLRPGVVHRLDKDTSGLIVIAKENRAYYRLVEQFREREIEKQYLALVYGNLKDDSGEIVKMIGRSGSDRKKMSTRTRRGKEAITHFTVVKRFNAATLVKVKILTGRTHQIRVHFASTGHPVLGDMTYGKKASLRSGQKEIKFPRQMLHAQYLKLQHPSTDEFMEFEAPVPEDMEKVIVELGEI
jgi:23S rRNA pseudouridine1911/1915/1917 synthase